MGASGGNPPKIQLLYSQSNIANEGIDKTYMYKKYVTTPQNASLRVAPI